MQSTMNEPPVDPRAPPEDQEMVEALTKALNRMIADHVTGQPTRIAVPRAHRCADSLIDRRLAQV
jgi:hypothetical protein